MSCPFIHIPILSFSVFGKQSQVELLLLINVYAMMQAMDEPQFNYLAHRHEHNAG